MGFTTARARRFLAIPIFLFVSLAVGSSAAAAAPSVVAVPSLTALSPFCVKAATYSKSSPSTNITALTPTTLQADYARFKSVEKAMLAQAPSALKADFQKIFAFDNALFAALDKAHWNFTKLSPATIKMLSTQGPALGPASRAIAAYFAKECGLGTPKP